VEKFSPTTEPFFQPLLTIKGCKDDFLKSLGYRVIDLLNHPSKISLGQGRRSFAICPKDDLPPCVKKRPTFAALSFCFLPQGEDQKRSELAYILLLEKRLSQQGLYLKLFNSHISKIDLTKDEPIIYVNCPRIPADLEAKTGYRRSNHNPNKKVKVFGYQAMITTNVELEIGLELPVGCITSPADKLDGSYLIPEREKFIKASYNVVKWPPIEKVEKERQSLSSLAVFCGGYPHLFMLPA